MRIWEEILQRLLGGEDPEEVRKDYRSASQFSKALRIYADRLAKVVEETREAFVQEEEKLEKTKGELERKRVEADELQENVQSLREENDELRAEVQNSRKEAETLRGNVESLDKAGYTVGIVELLKNSWANNGDEILEIIGDYEKATEVRTSIQHLMVKEEQLKRSVRTLEKKKQRVEGKLNSAKNSLDLIEAKVSALQKSINIVEAALQRGYSPGQLTGVLDFLENMEIRKNPTLSIQHLIEWVAAGNNLAGLKREIASEEEKIEKLTRIESEIEARIKIAKCDYLRNLDDEKEAIASIGLEAREEVKNAVIEMRENAKRFNEDLARCMFERGIIEQLRSSLEPAMALMGLPPFPNLLETVSGSTVIAMLENVGIWLEHRFPGAVAKVIYNPGVKEFASNDFASPIPVGLFPKYAAECVRELMQRETNGDVSH